MKISTYSAPHIHHQESTGTIMGDAILSILVVYAMCFYYYGIRVVMLLLVSVLTAVAADAACILTAGKKINTRNYSAIVTGMIIPLMMPASIDIHVVVAAAVFGIVVAKHPFGGVGQNIFNPAAAGIAFATICFPARMFLYPLPLEPLPLFPDETLVRVTSPAFTLQLGGVPAYELVDMSLGNFPGPMGATNILVILACLLYLVFRGSVGWQLPAVYIAVFSGMCMLFPRAGLSSEQTMLYETMSGTMLFGGVFMLNDPVTTPQRAWTKIAYGFFSAIVFFVFRRYSFVEEDFVFVLLLMNACVWGLDMLGEYLAGYFRRKRFETGNNKKIQKKAGKRL